MEKHTFMTELFSFFFSKHRSNFNEQDILSFLTIANEQYGSFQDGDIGAASSSLFAGCAPLNVFKLFLSRILYGIAHQPQTADDQVYTFLVNSDLYQ